ncbi:dipeptidyl peptidase 1 [Hydra vulgaris]|uniref:dipeptidyl peptidase 1 n=1 Tax=Hydra vulgaris TaxID=6087 RepID=UPI001F5F354F|nr:dipeptidyl peptidase 1 [Hydra vulgaris]
MTSMLKWFLLCFVGVSCDLPTNCSYEDTVGSWILLTSQKQYSNRINCSRSFDVASKLKVELLFPNYVVDEHGNVGTWTMIYNQGFEIIINGRRYFAFQYSFQVSPTQWASKCSETFNGWVHDIVPDHPTFPPKNWGCYRGKKLNGETKLKISDVPPVSVLQMQPLSKVKNYVNQINSVQSSWKASVYDHSILSDMVNWRRGSLRQLPRIKPRELTDEMMLMSEKLPVSLGWRNKDGINYISPIRDQGNCGSCYAFASMALLEAGVRILSNNTLKPVFSAQNIVSCSQYSQGCEGGFPYLVAGKYAQDFGVIEESQYPYTGNDSKCNAPPKVERTYVSSFGYVGGFYGGCNEVLMRVALNKIGPLAVNIEVYPDLQFYRSGIYHHTELDFKFNPFEITNHVVVVVGYGEEDGQKYWIVKNSWGEEWGEKGYFRIRRGTDEIAIESLVVYAVPYLLNLKK